MATVVVLNGTSSAGKTTAARAFQERAPGLFLNFSIDSILSALPRSALARITSGADISDLRYPELVRAFYACVRQLLALGHDLVIDHAVISREQAALLLEAIAGHEVLLVGLDCPAAVLRAREQARGDRRAGMAELQQRTIHDWLAYDLSIDTSTTSPEDAADRIVQALAGRADRALDADEARRLEAFAAAAEQYCAWAEAASPGRVRDARIARTLVTELFRRAIDLPRVDDFDGEAPEIPQDEYQRIYRRFGALPFNYYSECFDPLVVPAEKPVTADLADDLADIWRDVKTGLLLFRAGNRAAAAWQWRFLFDVHWGRHATSALYALQAWFSARSEDLDQLPERDR